MKLIGGELVEIWAKKGGGGRRRTCIYLGILWTVWRVMDIV